MLLAWGSRARSGGVAQLREGGRAAWLMETSSQPETLTTRITDNWDVIFCCIKLEDHNFIYVCVSCVHYESQCMDRCLHWSRVICLHYTTKAQPPGAIIYSDLPKHTHPETESSAAQRRTVYMRPWSQHGTGWRHPTSTSTRVWEMSILLNVVK